MAKRTDFNQVVAAKRKYSKLEIIGNLIVWLAPAIMMFFILVWNAPKLTKQDVSFHLELWMSIVLVIMTFIYIKWGRRKLHEKYVADNARAEKHSPLLVAGNSLVNLMPIILGILMTDVLKDLGEPIQAFLIVLFIFEAIGRIILFVDSFQEEEYED